MRPADGHSHAATPAAGPAGPTRSLVAAEKAALSPGMLAALDAAGAFPRIVAAASPLARIASLWRGYTPVLTLGDSIYWPGAPQDASANAGEMALLQHELQHVLDYAEGRLSWLAYGLWPPNWTYELPAPEAQDWGRLGAEQRAMLAESLWKAERKGEAAEAARLRAILPWG